MKLLISFLLSFLITTSYANTYYVSTTGNNNNSGLSSTQAWQSLVKLNTTTLYAKDVILFRRGDTFYGSLNITSDSLIFGAYGTGNTPVISGLTNVNSWTTIDDNKWESSTAISSLSGCNMVVINGVNTAKGRYPNINYDTIQSHVNNSSITDNKLGATNWTGAEVVIRILRYGLDINRITSQVGTTLNYTSLDHTFSPIDGYGYFIQDDSRTLDEVNEWYYNPITKKIQIYDITIPINVQVAIVDTLVQINNHNHITFKNLHFEGSNKVTIYSNNSSFISIENCDINYSGLSAIEIGSTSHYFTVNNCKITNSNDIGIINDNSTNLAILNSSFSKTGVLPGMGGLFTTNIATSQYSAGHHKAIQTCGDDARILNNHIDTTGYTAVYFTGNGTLIENNYINRYCFLLDDGGGIYSYSEFRNLKWQTRIIRNNIILNGIGAPSGCLNSAQYTNQTGGVYLDASNGDYIVSGNTVAYANKGILLSNSHRVTVSDNTLINNTHGIYTSNYTGEFKLEDVYVVRNNIVTYPTAGDITYAIYNIIQPDSSLPTTYRLNYNNYVNTNDSFNFRTVKPNVLTFDHSLSGWKNYSGNDKRSNNQIVSNLLDIIFVYNASDTLKPYNLMNNAIDAMGNTYKAGLYSIPPHQSRVFIKKNWINSKSFYKRKPIFVSASPALPSDLIAVADPVVLNGLDGSYTFTLAQPNTVSAGIFRNDSILVKTLFSAEKLVAGTYTRYWNGTDDNGNPINNPASNYAVKILTNNVQYLWQGTIGNTSDSMTGITKHRNYFTCMRGLAFGPTFGYYCSGYSEGTPSFAKFNINTPNQKIELISATESTADINYVATDGIKVYWGAFDANVVGKSFVFATNVSNDAYVTFPNGLSYTPQYRNQLNVVGLRSDTIGMISGLAVQKTGNYLFIARKDINLLQVINKTTGALIQSLNYTYCRGLSVDPNDNLLMAQSTTVSKFNVNADGTLTLVGTISGLQNPLSTQVSLDDQTLMITDGGTSQQVKCYNTSNGLLTETMGTVGGYLNDPSVNNNKFYFTDAHKEYLPFTAFQPNGTFWIGDAGNSRVQHYAADKSYLNRMMWLGATYSVFADKNNPVKVFSDFMEFEIDNSAQLISGNTGWKLKNNWGATVTYPLYDGPPKFITTLINGRTYGFIRKGYNYEIVEFPTTGNLRYTGIMLGGLSQVLCSDGALQTYTESGNNISLQKFNLLGFDSNNNPSWSTVPEVLASGLSDNLIGSPFMSPNGQAYGSTNKIALFNPQVTLQYGAIYQSGYHLGLMSKGANNTYLARTEKSTHRSYKGHFPGSGWFDVGNLVNDNAGGTVNIIDRNIITSYHGEFWKNSQTNKFNHYYDNGLALGQFGTTGPEANGYSAFAMMAGNANTPIVTKDINGDLYLWHGDESHHGGIHKWKISNLPSINIQSNSIQYPTNYLTKINGMNLMVGLPFDASLTTNTSGWTRSPEANNTATPYGNYWNVVTSSQSYDSVNTNDVTIGFNNNTAITSFVKRDLGTNNVAKNWKLTGNISFPATGVNYNNTVVQQFFEVLDNTGKVLITLNIAGGYMAPTFIYTNGQTLTSGSSASLEKEIDYLLPIDIRIVNGTVTFKYGNYAPVVTNISDVSGNWRTPAAMRIRFVNSGVSGTGYGKEITLQNMRFFTDFD